MRSLRRGWTRLCLHAGSLAATEGESESTTAIARAARAAHMKADANAASLQAGLRRTVTGAERRAGDSVQDIREKAIERATRMVRGTGFFLELRYYECAEQLWYMIHRV